MINKWKIALFLCLPLIRVNESQSEDQMEVRPHKRYKDLMCYYPKISSLAKLRDDHFFVSTNGQKFWIIRDSEEVTEQNSRDLKTITTNWHKIDASLYYGLNVECGHRLRDKLILVNYNEKTNKNEVIIGSLADWNWTSIEWSDVELFKYSSDVLNFGLFEKYQTIYKAIDWNKPIDDIAMVDETVFFFQNQIQMRIDCVYKDKKWVYAHSFGYRDIQISGPIDAAYCDDKYKDTYPLYVVRGKKYYICYINEDNNVWPNCEEFPLNDNQLTPKPMCFVDTDPNARLMASMSLQMKSMFVLVIPFIVFALIFLWNLWQDINKDTFVVHKDSPEAKEQSKEPNVSQSKQKTTKKVDK